QKLVAFLELKDQNGVRNGEKVVAPFNGYYIPTFPESWSYYYYDHENSILYLYGIFWTDGAERRVSSLELYDMDLVGELDLSGMTGLSEVFCDENSFTRIDASGCSQMRALTCKRCGLQELYISGCTALDLFDCSENAIRSLDASGCVTLTDIECADNKLSALSVSGCTSLQWLNCSDNDLTELDLSDNTSLSHLCCFGNKLTELDLSQNPGLPFDSIRAEGAGHIGYSNYSYFNDAGYWTNMNAAVAEQAASGAFLGWYSESGALISANPQLTPNMTNETRVIARFTQPDPIPGDANGDGFVNAVDALLVLRASMGLAQLSEEASTACDVDGSGNTDAADALIIMRFALGLIDTL
ncbi:MAG: hypothetical protein J6P98_01515, partial [Clostridia bacterium]|nr:hypothetical protein [Clostridia bacterium]